MSYKKEMKSVFSISIILILMLSSILLANVFAQSTENSPYTNPILNGFETRLTTDLSDQMDSHISGDIIVYTDYRGADADIWYYNLTSNTEQPVTTNPGYQVLNDVSFGRIVYDDYSLGDIFMYDTATGITTAITHNLGSGSNANEPAIGEYLVAWSERGDIFSYNLHTGEERQITNSPALDRAVDVANSLVVFQSCKPSCSVYAYDWNTNSVQPIETIYEAREPSVWCNKVVYSFEDPMMGNFDLAIFDLTTKIQQTLILEGDQINPHISENFVTFDDLNTMTVKVWDIQTNIVYNLDLDSQSYQFFNDIDNNHITYTDNRMGQFDVYMYTFEDPRYSLDLFPTSIEYNEIPIGSSFDKIVTLKNTGNMGVLIVETVFSPINQNFILTLPVILPFMLDPGTSIDFIVSFDPKSIGLTSTNLQITTSNPNAPIISIPISGTGIAKVEKDPVEQINDILIFFDQSVATGILTGTGSGHSAKEKLNVLRTLIVQSKAFIVHDCNKNAKIVLNIVLLFIDGAKKPSDFAKGPATVQLGAMIQELLASLDNSSCYHHTCHNHQK